MKENSFEVRVRIAKRLREKRKKNLEIFKI